MKTKNENNQVQTTNSLSEAQWNTFKFLKNKYAKEEFGRKDEKYFLECLQSKNQAVTTNLIGAMKDFGNNVTDNVMQLALNDSVLLEEFQQVCSTLKKPEKRGKEGKDYMERLRNSKLGKRIKHFAKNIGSFLDEGKTLDDIKRCMKQQKDSGQAQWDSLMEYIGENGKLVVASFKAPSKEEKKDVLQSKADYLISCLPK